MAKTMNAVTRVPLPGGGEFVAWWPQTATRGDLQIASDWMAGLLGVWARDADSRADARAAAEAEYRSWLVTPNVELTGIARERTHDDH